MKTSLLFAPIRIFMFLFCLLPIPSKLCAQQTIPCGGGDIIGDNGSVSYTVGQIAFLTYTNSDMIFTEGTQQPWEIFAINGSFTRHWIDLKCAAHPNPASDVLYLTLNTSIPEDLSYILCDIKGSVLQKKSIFEQNTILNLSPYKSSNYILRIQIKNQDIQVFKIVKK